MISLRSVSKRYGELPPAVSDLSLEIEDGELCVLIGPSGSGKTTTLKMINRLIEPTSGEISVNGRNIMTTDVTELRRSMGYVMQQGGLFPHQRVAANVATVPRLLGWPKQKITSRVNELLELVGLDPDRYARRFPHELSGGERQRVGVARALGGDPPVLLMDEPFGAVDPITRTHLQEEFGELQRRLGKTVVFVTHDIQEAVALGTRIAIFSPGGVLEQYGTPAEVLARSASDFVTEFVGAERGLQRLAVTKVAPEHLSDAPEFTPNADLAETNARLFALGFRFGVVRNEDGMLAGWVARADDPAAGARQRGQKVGSAMRRFSAVTPIGASLEDALAAMLRNDDGFTAITDGDQVIGVLTPDDLHAALRRSLVETTGPEPGPSSGRRSETRAQG